jgi:hypothetical protein
MIPCARYQIAVDGQPRSNPPNISTTKIHMPSHDGLTGDTITIKTLPPSHAPDAGPAPRWPGRFIYRMRADRELWRWMIRLWAPSHGPNGGVASSLGEAEAAFRAARKRPLPSEKADEICSA